MIQVTLVERSLAAPERLFVKVLDPGLDDDLWLLRRAQDRSACVWNDQEQTWVIENPGVELRNFVQALALPPGDAAPPVESKKGGDFPDEW